MNLSYPVTSLKSTTKPKQRRGNAFSKIQNLMYVFMRHVFVEQWNFDDLQVHKVERKKDEILLRWTPPVEGWMKLQLSWHSKWRDGPSRIKEYFTRF